MYIHTDDDIITENCLKDNKIAIAFLQHLQHATMECNKIVPIAILYQIVITLFFHF